MSYDLNVYLQSDSLTDQTEITEALRQQDPPVIFAQPPDFMQADGFVPLRFGDERTGFELLASRVPQSRRDNYRRELVEAGEDEDDFYRILTTCDTVLMFSAGNVIEIEAARTVARIIAALTDGYLDDPQTGETIHGRDIRPPGK